MNIKNPLDIGPSGIFPAACAEIFGDPDPDGFILVPVIPFAAIEIYTRLGLKAKNIFGDWPALRGKAEGKPVVAVLLGYEGWTDQIKELCGQAVATVSSPEAAVKALSALRRVYCASAK